LIFIFKDEVPGRVKMHTKSFNLNNWIYIDKTYPEQMALRQELLRTKLDLAFVSANHTSTKLAKQETLDLLLEYLPKRFPAIFQKTNEGIYNNVLKEHIIPGKEDPLITASRLVQDDWCIMEWNEQHKLYVLTAGVVLFPMRWSLVEKFTQTLPVIHQPVTAFGKHLQHTVNDLFESMTPSSPVWRANWAIFNDLEGPQDLFTPAGHVVRNHTNKITSYDPQKTGRDLVFRVEYQTLRKLPKSGAILFGIRTYQRFLEDFLKFPKEDSVALLSSIKGLQPEMSVYKGAEFWKEAAIQYLSDIVNHSAL